MAEIQRNIIKQGKRNPVSRYFHTKSDKEAVAGWRLGLNRILRVFNVRLITSVRLPLTFHRQAELAINTNVVVSDIRHDVVNTHTIVSEIHRTVVGSHRTWHGKNQSVGVARTPLAAGSILTVAADPGQVNRLE